MSALPHPTRLRRTPSWSPGPLRRLLRRPLVYWAVVLAGAAWAAVLISVATPDPIARPVQAWRTTGTVAAGEAIAGHAERIEIPGFLEPSEIMVDLPHDAMAARTLGANVVLRAGDLADATSLAPGEAALAVPLGPGTPAVTAGSPVMLVIDADPFAGTAAAMVPGRVVALQPDHTLVAFDRADVAAAAAALRLGTATLALTAG